MAKLYSDFLFNPLGSSCAPSSQASLLLKVPCPKPRPCQGPGQEQPLCTRQWLCARAALPQGSQHAGMSPVGPGRSATPATPTSVFEPWKWGGPRCAGILWISAVLWAGIGHLGAVNRVVPTPLFPSEGKPQLLPSFFLPSSVRWSDACLKCVLRKPEEGGVAQAAPGPSPNRLGWFSGH